MLMGGSPGPVDDADLAAAYPWPDRFWVRAMMVMTLDGAAAGADGRSRSISSDTDRLIFDTVRRLSDVVLIGAGTMRAEHYQPPSTEHSGQRAAQGLAPAPVVAIVSGSLDLPWDEPLFGESGNRPLVITGDGAAADRLATARAHAEVLTVPGARPEPAMIISALRDRGYRRIVCEGGPQLLANLIGGHLVDEVDLAISPLMAGGGQLLTGEPFPEPAGFELHQVLTDGAFLFTRYLAAPTAARDHS